MDILSIFVDYVKSFLPKFFPESNRLEKTRLLTNKNWQ